MFSGLLFIRVSSTFRDETFALYFILRGGLGKSSVTRKHFPFPLDNFLFRWSGSCKNLAKENLCYDVSFLKVNNSEFPLILKHVFQITSRFYEPSDKFKTDLHVTVFPPILFLLSGENFVSSTSFVVCHIY